MRNKTLFAVFAVSFVFMMNCSSADPEAWTYFIPAINTGETVFSTLSNGETKFNNTYRITKNEPSQVKLHTEIVDKLGNTIGTPTDAVYELKNNRIVRTYWNGVLGENTEVKEIGCPRIKIGNTAMDKNGNEQGVISKLNLTVETLAGEFKDCISVSNEFKIMGKNKTTMHWYCKHVGEVKILSSDGSVFQLVKLEKSSL